MSEFIVRPAVNSDLDALLRLYAEIRPDGPVTERTDQLDGTWLRMLDDPAVLVAVAQQGPALVATAMLAIVPSVAKGPSPFGVIEHVVTAASARGQGFAERVMRFAIERAWQADCYKVVLLSGQTREAAHRLYGRLGFDGDTERGFELKRPPDL